MKLTPELTIFYDGNCPLCHAEMQHLKKHDAQNNITLVDIHKSNFSTQHPEIHVEQAMTILHAQYQGKLLLGLEVTHQAWTTVGKGFWVAPLNWPIIKNIAHICYVFFAKYRHQISQFLAPKLGITLPNCDKGTCYEKPTNANHRSK